MIISAVGNSYNGFSGDNGPAANAQISGPASITFDRHGNMFICDFYNNRIRKVDSRGIITTLAGNGNGGYSGNGGPATAAQISKPLAIVVDNSDNIYFADGSNNCIRKINPAGIITLLDSFNASPTALAIDKYGSLYYADQTSIKIYKRDISGSISVLAGNGIPGYSGDGGKATLAEIGNTIVGIGVDSSGYVYISDYDNSCIRIVDTNGAISTLAITANGGLFWPAGICFDNKGIICVADEGDGRICKIDKAGVLSTIAGYSIFSTGAIINDGIAATSSYLANPISVAVSPKGEIYEAELNGAWVRKITDTVLPIIASDTILCTGHVYLFADSTAGGVWTSTNNKIATIDNSGKLTTISQGIDTIIYGGVASLTLNIRQGAIITGADSIVFGTKDTLSSTWPGGAWSCTDTSIAKIDTSGIISTVSDGSTTVIYSYPDSCGVAHIIFPIVVCHANQISGYATFVTWLSPAYHTYKISLLAKTTNPTDSLFVVDSLFVKDTGSSYKAPFYFYDEPAGVYLIKAEVLNDSVEKSVPTYDSSTVFWDKAKQIVYPGLGFSLNNIIFVQNAQPTSGVGTIGGKIMLQSDTGRSILPGILVYILNVGGQIVASGYTDQNGYYSFDSLNRVKYIVYPEVEGYTTTPSGVFLSAKPNQDSVNFTEYSSPKTIVPETVNVPVLLKNNNISIYPNPACNEVIIHQASNVLSTAQVTIIDVVGRQVLSTSVMFNRGNAKLSLALAKGVYLLRINNGNEILHTERLVIY